MPSPRCGEDIALLSRMVRTRLPGGPTLLMLPDKKAKVAAVQIWLPAGAHTEGPGKGGLSHFLEHMIFKGSRELEIGELANLIEASGGDVNAYTMSDATYYHFTCLPEGLETCLGAMAEAAWWPRFDPAEIERERRVIFAEIDRANDHPDQRLQEALFQRAYGANHPFGVPILGTRATVRRLDRHQLLHHHHRRYAPAGAVVVLAGAVKEDMVRTVLQRVLRGLPGAFHRGTTRTGRSPAIPPPSPKGEGPRTFVLRGRSGLAHLELAFAAPPFLHPDAPALEVFAMILGMGESSRLYSRLCVEKPLMHDVSTDVFFSIGPGLFFLGGAAAPADVRVAAENIIRVARSILEGEPPTKEEIERVRLTFEAEFQFRRERVSGRAQAVGYVQLQTGNAHFAQIFLQRVKTVRQVDVLRVARKYLSPRTLTAGAFLPEGANALEARELRRAIHVGFSHSAEATRARKKGGARGGASETLLALSARKISAFPVSLKRGAARFARKKGGAHRAALPGGARLLVLHGSATPVFALRAVFLGGQRLEGKERAGMHSLMADVATQATRSMDSDLLSRRIDGLAISLSGFAGRNSLGISFSCLSSVAQDALEIFAEMLEAPAFDPDDIILARREAEAERRSDLDDLGHLSRLRSMSALYGDHPFARHLLGSRLTLARLNTKVLRRAWRRWVVPGNMVIGAAGEIDPAGLTARLRRLTKRWAERAPGWHGPKKPAPPRPLTRARARRHVVEDAGQSHIHLSFLGTSFFDPRRFALSVLAAALGSQGGGLFMELRERRGLAYALHVLSDEGLDPGPFSLYAATAPEAEDEAITLMRGELERVRSNGLGRDELERAKAFLIGGHARAHQRASARASELAYCARYGLPYESEARFIRRIRAVTGAAVRAAAREFLAPERECLVRLGPALRKRQTRSRKKRTENG